jgi:ATPase subunit of ABC transporter with duplicated ATPase domains
MLSKMMMERPNVVLLNEPTNHLDLESITAFNNSLNNYKGTLLCSTSDHAFAQTLGTRIVELTPGGLIDRHCTFDEFMTDPKVKELRLKFHGLA